MVRRLMVVVIAAAMTVVGLIGTEGAASAAASPLLLVLPQGTAFSYLGHSCGGIREQVFATGFDATSGFPTGEVNLKTSCGGSGRGGGYHTTTYTASVGVTWDFTAAVVATGPPPAGAPNPTFSAFDSHGNQVYNLSNSAHLILSPTFVPAPRITGLSPTLGPASGGTSVTIIGTGFTGATALYFGWFPAASITVNSDSSITATSPAVAGSGTADVVVVTAGGPSVPSAVDQFTFVAAPSVSSVSPNSGSIYGGTTLTIAGAHFTGATTVNFGDTAVGFTVNDDSSITVVTPVSDAADTVDITVVSLGGTSAVSPADQFSYTIPTGCGACLTVGFSSSSIATAAVGVPFSFSITTFGGSVSKMKEQGKPPTGVTFLNNNDGTATLSGTPTSTKTKPAAGTYYLSITATFGAGKSKQLATQILTLTVS